MRALVRQREPAFGITKPRVAQDIRVDMNTEVHEIRVSRRAAFLYHRHYMRLSSPEKTWQCAFDEFCYIEIRLQDAQRVVPKRCCPAVKALLRPYMPSFVVAEEHGRSRLDSRAPGSATAGVAF
ncbi:hypothetical protein GCM10011322_01840 [Salinarimonas ramus]|uniref:Uncharacterized protein n=1 Tax=Salinarimonas ramus TaxID=690164 RepID=A0A917V244_9HYPH|nr:hypothetical protein GCM10011322_01840 [Salinarimonas ramus]